MYTVLQCSLIITMTSGVVKVLRHKATSPPKTDGTIVFTRWYVPSMRAHWHHLVNTTELVLPLAHPSPQPKLQIYRFSRFCRAHGGVTLGMPSPLKIASSHRVSGPSSNTRFLGPIQVHNPNGISIGSAVSAGLGS